MKIPSRILEAICNDELQAQDFYDVYGKKMSLMLVIK